MKRGTEVYEVYAGTHGHTDFLAALLLQNLAGGSL